MCFECIRFLNLEEQERFVVMWQTGPELRTNVSIDIWGSKVLFRYILTKCYPECCQD